MIIDCIGCLHGFFPKLEGGDVLIVTGDLTTNDQDYSLYVFYDWLAEQSYSKKIYIGGNHDNRLGLVNDATPKYCRAIYLEDSGAEFQGLRIWGSPWTLKFPGMNPKCMAFSLDTEEELAQKWSLIPQDIDILITHTPPYGILDRNKDGNSCGSVSLRNKSLSQYIKLNVFSHIHEQGGQTAESDGRKWVNCSHVNERYQPVNEPIRIFL